MAEPSAVTMGTALAQACKVSQEFSEAARTASTGLLATLEATRDALSGRIASSAAVGVEEIRAVAADAISRDLGLSVIVPILRQLALAYDLDSAQEGGESQLMLDLYDEMITQTHYVKQRALTYGSPSAGGSNVGDGTCLRLTVDEQGHELQGWFADTLTLECESDQTLNGRTLQETFRLRGTAESPDLLELDGYGPEIDQSGIPVASALLTEQSGLLTNPSFDEGTFSGTTITTLTGWETPVSGDWTNYETDTTSTYIYLDSTNGGTARNLRQTADDTVYQGLVTTARASFPRDVPFLIGVRVYRRDSCDGTLTLRLSSAATSGGISNAVSVSGLSAGWNTVYLVATPGANCWPANFWANTLKFSIQLASRTTGSLHFSDTIFVPFTRVGALGDNRSGRGAMGTYLALVSGQTPFMRKDTFTITDSETEADRGVIQFWLSRYGLGYLPSIDDATQVTASGGRTLTWADADPDTITASSGDFTSDGFAAGMTLTVAGTSNNNGTFKIASVTSTVITLEAGEALTAEGPLSATATLDATAYFPDAS